MHKYYLGVDVGGTKSHAVIADDTGQVAGFGQAGSGSWEFVGYDGLAQALAEITTQAVEMAGIDRSHIKGAGFGLAGFDWPSQRQAHLDVIQSLGLDCPVILENDAALGIPAAAREGWGVSVVSGTGCNCRGWNADRSRTARVVGGHSEWSDEAAGGWDILLRALRAVSFEWTHRGPATALTGAFLEKTGAPDLDNFIEGLYLQQFNFDNSDIMLVFEIAAQGDPAALDVMRWAGDQLGQMACGVIRQLELESDSFDVVQIGSLYSGHPLISEQMGRTIRGTAPRAQLVRLNASPVVGGVLLGMEAGLGKAAYTRRQAVLDSFEAFQA